MPKREPKPAAHTKVLDLLRQHAGSAEVHLWGADAITDWLVASGFTHGKRPSWSTVCRWNRQSAELGLPLLYHPCAKGPLRGRPLSTNFLLLAWCMSVAPFVVGPRWSKYMNATREARRS